MLLQLKADDEQGAEDGEEDGEDDVKEVEPDVEGEGLAADVQGVPALLRQVGVVEILLLLLHSQGHVPSLHQVGSLIGGLVKAGYSHIPLFFEGQQVHATHQPGQIKSHHLCSIEKGIQTCRTTSAIASPVLLCLTVTQPVEEVNQP